MLATQIARLYKEAPIKTACGTTRDGGGFAVKLNADYVTDDMGLLNGGGSSQKD